MNCIQSQNSGSVIVVIVMPMFDTIEISGTLSSPPEDGEMFIARKKISKNSFSPDRVISSKGFFGSSFPGIYLHLPIASQGIFPSIKSTSSDLHLIHLLGCQFQSVMASNNRISLGPVLDMQ